MHIVSWKRAQRAGRDQERDSQTRKLLRVILFVEAAATACGRQETNTVILGRHAEAGRRATPKLNIVETVRLRKRGVKNQLLGSQYLAPEIQQLLVNPEAAGMMLSWLGEQ